MHGLVRSARWQAPLVAVVLATAGLPSPSAIARATPKERLCGHVDATVVIAARHVSCGTARSVGRHYVDTSRGSHHFRCRRYPVQAAAGWYAICSRGRARVHIVPE